MSALDDVRLVEPLPYLESLRLIAGARLVLTDSGGIQEETTALGVPCVTLRSTTERPITIVQGTNRLAPDRTKEEILKLVSRVAGRRECALDQWDGRTAGRIADVLVDWHRTTQKKAFLVGGGIEA
jgi:UDP-N-acetylglucosamine 2-epimerase (non-hydrolysing)